MAAPHFLDGLARGPSRPSGGRCSGPTCRSASGCAAAAALLASRSLSSGVPSLRLPSASSVLLFFFLLRSCRLLPSSCPLLCLLPCWCWLCCLLLAPLLLPPLPPLCCCLLLLLVSFSPPPFLPLLCFVGVLLAALSSFLPVCCCLQVGLLCRRLGPSPGLRRSRARPAWPPRVPGSVLW